MIGNFAGGRLSAANTVRDGINVSAGRFEDGAWSVTYSSPDLVEEVKVVVAPVDAQTSRGSGQVSMVTRSGTNQIEEAYFWQITTLRSTLAVGSTTSTALQRITTTGTNSAGALAADRQKQNLLLCIV
jgi:hypothetical protein